MNTSHIRITNSTRYGGGFDAATIEAVWNKARGIPGFSSEFRVDACGALIYRAVLRPARAIWLGDRSHSSCLQKRP